MTTSESPARPGGVPVLRPVGIRQVSAVLAVGAAVAGVLSTGVGLSSTWGPSDGFLGGVVVTRVAGGESLRGGDGGEWTWASLEWNTPVLLAVLLLVAAAVAALLGARDVEPGPRSAVAQVAALGGAGLLAGIAGVQVVVARADIALATDDEMLSAQWGPAVGVLVVGTLLALVAAVTARRGRPRVLAVVDLPDATLPEATSPGASRPDPTWPDQWNGAGR